MTRHLLSVADYGPHQMATLVDAAARLKQQPLQPLLAGRSVALVFEKPSLRTRVSFDVGIHQMGGHAVYLNQQQIGLDSREPIEDVIRVLSRMVDAVVVRTFAHRHLERMVAAGSIPVINALSDHEHPCQALADLLTLHEHFGRLQGIALSYIGDGNNVANSLALAAAATGIRFTIACPEGYSIDPVVWERATALAGETGAELREVRDPAEAARGADALYTDVWTSMGQEEESAARERAFAGYHIDQRLVSLAAPGAVVLHDLPAHRGQEIDADVFEAFAPIIFTQAENRLHMQKAILADLVTTPAP